MSEQDDSGRFAREHVVNQLFSKLVFVYSNGTVHLHPEVWPEQGLEKEGADNKAVAFPNRRLNLKSAGD